MTEPTFASLGVSPAVCSALSRAGIETPFPIQTSVMPDILAGRDVLAKSPTGSGKTLAFGIPLVERARAAIGRASALVLVPTRELASQVALELSKVAKARGLRVEAVYGGVPQRPQVAAARRADILIATPGRLEDLLQQRELGVDAIGMFVLDEADRMLDMGFQPQVDAIVKRLPERHQTLFFSATLDGAVGKLAERYTQNPVRHEVAPKADEAVAIAHRFVAAERGEKVDALVAELRNERDLTLVFVRTKHGADRLARDLHKRGVTAEAIHGDKSQSARERALAAFDKGRTRVLVATDVAARGIDVDRVSHVINFDAPPDREGYVHRTGRTGRAGREGTAVTFVSMENEAAMSAIVNELKLLEEYQRDGFLVRSPERPAPRRRPRGSRPAGARRRAATGSRGAS
ncbi:MAG: DEAD/DEAH box helicase [Actinobacteria bacterium]|nr:DEAD/DEAH box helicase [Actinomycetota bacterium]